MCAHFGLAPVGSVCQHRNIVPNIQHTYVYSYCVSTVYTSTSTISIKKTAGMGKNDRCSKTVKLNEHIFKSKVVAILWCLNLNARIEWGMRGDRFI